MPSLLGLLAIAAAVVATVPSPQSLDSDVTILINDDLQGANSPYANSAVLVLSSPQTYASASASCQALNEQLWQPNGNTSLIQPDLDYLKYEGQITASSKFWIAAKQGCSSPRTIDGNGKVSGGDPSTKLPVLCTQTAGFSSPSAANTSAPWQISVASNNETYIGFRDRLSFRFLGIRYAAQPERFTYTSLYSGSGQTVDALQFGSICAQGGQGTEDCFFLNVWTDYLPGPTAKKSALKPVMFWIHGGAFTGGEGSDPTADGANLAARGDVVVVTINYRLGSLGFLALNDGKTNGNFGFADQITALDWVRKNIADFGGDPDRITIFGQSAGAGSVRAMLASPKALGKFAGAIMLSNLGGIGYGTTYSLYYTIAQEVNVAANSVLASTGCTDAASQVDCLRNVSYVTLSNLPAARYLVVDGTYLTTDQLQLNGPAAPYKLMMGTMRDDGAPFIGFPTTTNVTVALQQDGFPNVPSTLFVEPTGANQTLDTYNVTAEVATDGIFRCIDEATAYAGLQNGKFEEVYYYEFNRSYQTTGYPGTDVCEPPKSAAHPYGNPDAEYFKCHSGELYYVFGQIVRLGLPFRDANDLPFEQFTVDSFASFARTYDPNPDSAFLQARRYSNTLNEIATAGTWKPSTKGDMTVRELQWPSFQTGLLEKDQCNYLNLSLTYYTSGPGLYN